MRIQKSILKLFAVLALVHGALAGPGGFIEIDNGTPYDWKLVNSHSYQLSWNPVKVIAAGASVEQYLEYKAHHSNGGDDAAEATYTLVGSPTPMSFTIQARQKPRMTIQVQYHDTLASLGNPENSVMDLGYTEKGAVSFVLTGNDTSNFMGSNPPVAWMQATFPIIGSKSLRNIAMPESHDAGISELTHQWMGVSANTQTQANHIYKQLLLGARWFDIRPAHYKGHWYTGHFSKGVGKYYLGATGRTIEHIVDDINRFTSEHPGELIVIDLSHDQDIDNWWSAFSELLWQMFFRELLKINDLWIPSNGNLPDDLSTLPLNSFITPGSNSAVLVVIPDGGPLPSDKPLFHRRSIEANLYSDIPRTFPPEPDTNPSPPNFDHLDEPENPEDPEIPPIDTENGFGDYPNSESFNWTTYWQRLNHTFPKLELNYTLDLNSTNVTSASHFVIYSHKPKTPKPVDLKPMAGNPAFIHWSRIPSTGSYSDTRWEKSLVPDQLNKLSSLRSSPSAEMHHSVWTITQKWTDVVDVWTKAHSIMYMARYAKHDLLRELWNHMVRGQTFPNLIEIDNIKDNSVVGLCVGINSYFST